MRIRPYNPEKRRTYRKPSFFQVIHGRWGKDEDDLQAIIELGVGDKIGQPMTHEEAKTLVDKINRRSSQLRTYARRGLQPPPLQKE